QLFVLANHDRNLLFGSKGTDVWALQVYLMFDGMPDGAKLLTVGPTGVFGTLTQQAVIEFQRSVHISATGLVGPLTRGALK
ncbi:MAG: peptidoglycan-binding protein, partial [Patescibacteria group bacterium]|nr:peptidoglycan-binding protein [Patescibacteria group bacterium]